MLLVYACLHKAGPAIYHPCWFFAWSCKGGIHRSSGFNSGLNIWKWDWMGFDIGWDEIIQYDTGKWNETDWTRWGHPISITLQSTEFLLV